MREMTPHEAQAAWLAGQVNVVDVREQVEHDNCRVAGMPLVPMSELGERLDDLPTDRPLVVMCRSGGRSAQVADFLSASTDIEAINLSGGIIAWAADGLPYEGDPPR